MHYSSSHLITQYRKYEPIPDLQDDVGKKVGTTIHRFRQGCRGIANNVLIWIHPVFHTTTCSVHPSNSTSSLGLPVHNEGIPNKRMLLWSLAPGCMLSTGWLVLGLSLRLQLRLLLTTSMRPSARDRSFLDSAPREQIWMIVYVDLRTRVNVAHEHTNDCRCVVHHLKLGGIP